MNDGSSPQIVAVDPTAPDPDVLARALEVLRAGGIVALPTETFYGLAVDPRDAGALARLRRAKGLEPDSPILLLVADRAQAAALVPRLPAAFGALADRFWPGPLTLVVPAADGSTVALRQPGLALACRLAAELGAPLTGTSANRHGGAPSRTAAAVLQSLGAAVALILDGGTTAGGAPSTIVDLSVEPPRVLRAGLLPVRSIRRFVELGDGDV